MSNQSAIVISYGTYQRIRAEALEEAAQWLRANADILQIAPWKSYGSQLAEQMLLALKERKP